MKIAQCTSGDPPIWSSEQFMLSNKIQQISMCICQFKNNKEFQILIVVAKYVQHEYADVIVRIRFLLLFCFCFPFVTVFTDWFLLAKSYFNATALSKVLNNQIKQNFPRFLSFRFWVQGKIENSEISEIFIFSFKSYRKISVFPSVHIFVIFKS